MASHVGLPVMKLPLINPAPLPIQTAPTRIARPPMTKLDRTRRTGLHRAASNLASDLEQAVVIRCWIASAIGVGVGQQQTATVSGHLDSAEPAVFSTEVRYRITGLGALNWNLPQPLAAQSCHPERVLPVRQP